MIRSHFIVPVLVILTLGWCLLIVTPPVLHALDSHVTEAFIRLAFAPICHQLPERSFAPGGAPMAVCARCLGAYAGFLAGAMSFLGLSVSRGHLPRSPGRLLLAGSTLPTFFQWSFAAAGILPDIASARALTSSVFGIVIAFCILPAVDSLARELRERRGPSMRGRLNAEPT